MKRILVLIGVILFTLAASAAPVAITATITDSDSIVWSSAAWSAQLSAGGPVFNGITDGSGVLTDSSNFQSGGVYDVTICPNAFVNCSLILNVTISTSSAFQTSINAGIIAPRFPASGALHTSFGYADVELANPTVNDSYFNVVSGVNRFFCGTLGWGTVACTTIRPGYFNSVEIIGDGANTWYKPLSSSNLNNWRTLSSIAGAADGDFRIQHTADGFSTINGDFRISPTGVVSVYSDVNVAGNVNVQGSLNSTTNQQPAGITNTGTQIAAASNNTNILMFNSTYTTNNRTAENIWFNNCLQTRFKSDDQSIAITPLSLCGGQGTGITGITSSSGSGTWSHTGPFSASGQITGSPVQGAGYNWINITGAGNGSSPTITTGGGNTNVTLTISPKGSGGTTIVGAAAVTGTMTVASSLVCTANGANCPYVPIFGTTGSIGGSLLAVGSCSIGTATVVGATVGHTVSAAPSNGADPGGGFIFRGYVTNSTTVTVQICATVLGTPAAVTYNISTY